MPGREAIKRTPDQHPVILAGYGSIGVASVIALHATVWPRFREVDFALYLAVTASFVTFSLGYLVWIRFFQWTRATGASPGSPEEPDSPTADGTAPVPVVPRSPVMRRGEAKALPVVVVTARKLNPLPIAVMASTEPVDPETGSIHAPSRAAD